MDCSGSVYCSMGAAARGSFGRGVILGMHMKVWRSASQLTNSPQKLAYVNILLWRTVTLELEFTSFGRE